MEVFTIEELLLLRHACFSAACMAKASSFQKKFEQYSQLRIRIDQLIKERSDEQKLQGNIE